LNKLQDNLIVPIRNIDDVLSEIHGILLNNNDLDLKRDVATHIKMLNDTISRLDSIRPLLMAQNKVKWQSTEGDLRPAL
jgi:hypothetical protein